MLLRIQQGHIVLSWLLIALSWAVGAGLVCDAEIMTPKWYEPEYESSSVQIRIATITKTVTGKDTLSTERYNRAISLNYGSSSRPLEPLPTVIHIIGSEDTEHRISMAFNGTHACVAFNHDTTRSIWHTSSRCVHACAEAFRTNSSSCSGDDCSNTVVKWEQLEFYVNDITETHVYEYLSFESQQGDFQTSVSCYDRAEPYGVDDSYNPDFAGDTKYCSVGEKCTMTVARKNATSPTLYYSRCQLNNTDICANQGCRNNSQAPYIGDGAYNSVCDWCCGYDLCNNINNCTSYECYFYGEHRNLTIIVDDNDISKAALAYAHTTLRLLTIISSMLMSIRILF